jgi:hypothetical protein
MASKKDAAPGRHGIPAPMPRGGSRTLAEWEQMAREEAAIPGTLEARPDESPEGEQISGQTADGDRLPPAGAAAPPEPPADPQPADDPTSDQPAH